MKHFNKGDLIILVKEQDEVIGYIGKFHSSTSDWIGGNNLCYFYSDGSFGHYGGLSMCQLGDGWKERHYWSCGDNRIIRLPLYNGGAI